MLPFPVKTDLVDIFPRATPGSSLVNNIKSMTIPRTFPYAVVAAKLHVQSSSARGNRGVSVSQTKLNKFSSQVVEHLSISHLEPAEKVFTFVAKNFCKHHDSQ